VNRKNKNKRAKYPNCVAIDTQILIYSLREKFETEEQKSDSANAQTLMASVLSAGSRICISAITVAEYLVGVEQINRNSTLLQLTSSFDVAAFNTRSAAIAADLFPSMKQASNANRKIFSADSKIVSTIIAHNCRLMYTNDGDLSKLEHPEIEIRLLPKQQPRLFDDDDMDKHS